MIPKASMDLCHPIKKNVGEYNNSSGDLYTQCIGMSKDRGKMLKIPTSNISKECIVILHFLPQEADFFLCCFTEFRAYRRSNQIQLLPLFHEQLVLSR